MNKQWELFWERAVSVFKYIVSGYMMVAGVLTVLAAPDTTVTGSLHIIYGVRPSLIIIGILIFASGFTLFLGKVKRNKKLTGRGIFATYLCFFFATFLNLFAYGSLDMWITNAVMSVVMALLWLRWKFKTDYVNPKHFRNDVYKYRKER